MKLNITTGRLSAVLTAALLMSLAGIARATLVEGFEGSLSEPTVGDAGIKTTYHGIAPTEGTHQLLLTTINNTSDGPTYSHEFADAVTNATLASFFGVSGTLIRDGAAVSQEGSGFSISLGTLTAGTQITFSYDFLTTEFGDGHHNDFAYYTLTGLSGVSVIADTNSGLLHPTTDGTNPFNLETGYQTFTINILSTGTYTLGLGVSDATTTDNPSALLIDNIQVISPVPEPTTIAFSIAGASLLVALRRRIKRTS
jgi:uncharacterized membrane protein YuzA (DUF378 family)